VALGHKTAKSRAVDSEAKARAHNSLYIAPKLRELQITTDVLAAYDCLIEEFVKAHKGIDWTRIPPGLCTDLFRLVLHKTPDRDLMARLQSREPSLYRWLVVSRKLAWTERLLEGEVTKELLALQRERLYKQIKGFDWPLELIEIWVSRYSRRPKGQPASKRVRYLVALDYKRRNPATTWGSLARQFAGGTDKTNTLKAWCMATKKRLAELGLNIDIENPDYKYPGK
jgi:hypothetical protein